MPLASQTEANLLNSAALFGATRYLRLLQWNGTAGQGTGTSLNEDGSLPANVTEPTTGGYAAHQVLSSEWGAAVAGAPSEKVWPGTGQLGYTFTPTGGASWNIIGYAWTTNNSAITSANVISFGVMLDSLGDPATVTVDNTHPLAFNTVFPIIERFGDCPSGLDPT